MNWLAAAPFFIVSASLVVRGFIGAARQERTFRMWIGAALIVAVPGGWLIDHV